MIGRNKALASAALDRSDYAQVLKFAQQQRQLLDRGAQHARRVEFLRARADAGFGLTLDSMNKILASQSMQQLPTDMQSTLRELNRSMQGFQPGSAAYNKMVADMQRLDQVLRELQPVLKTLNEKSNALVFEAKDKKDPEPKRAKQ